MAAQFLFSYHRLTENWIRTQVEGLERYEPLVLSHRTENVPPGALPPHYALEERNAVEWIANRALKLVLGYFPGHYLTARRRGATLVHAHFGQWGVMALPLARALGVPLVARFYGYDLTRLLEEQPRWRRGYDRLFEEAGRLLVEGPHMGSRLEAMGCPPGKVRVLPLGVALDDFPFRPRSPEPGEELRVLSVGRFTEKKGFADAVEALARLRARGAPATLTLVGDAGDDPAEAAVARDLEARIDRLGVGDVVRRTGSLPREELTELYYRHHVLLAPSVEASSGDTEGGAPVTLVEAHATGMPAVATRHCDIPHVVEEGVTGFLAPEGDPDALASLLERLVERPGRVEEMGRAARRRAEDRFDAGDRARELEEIYDAVRREARP